MAPAVVSRPGPAPLAGRAVTAIRRSFPRYRPVPAGHGAMLAVMAAWPPAADQPASRGSGTDSSAYADLRRARHAVAAAPASPTGQVRAVAWLLGVKAPAFPAYTCSRLAAGAAGAGSRAAAVRWLVRAGLGRPWAETVAELVWPGQVPAAGGVVGEGHSAGRGQFRRRLVDAGLGAAGPIK